MLVDRKIDMSANIGLTQQGPNYIEQFLSLLSKENFKQVGFKAKIKLKSIELNWDTEAKRHQLPVAHLPEGDDPHCQGRDQAQD